MAKIWGRRGGEVGRRPRSLEDLGEVVRGVKPWFHIETSSSSRV